MSFLHYKKNHFPYYRFSVSSNDSNFRWKICSILHQKCDPRKQNIPKSTPTQMGTQCVFLALPCHYLMTATKHFPATFVSGSGQERFAYNYFDIILFGIEPVMK